MKHKPTIQRFVAAIMLVLFVCSITPKRFLHHWFANHKDITASLADNHHQPQLHTQGIGCDCDHLVATSPFTNPTMVWHFAIPAVYGQTTADLTAAIYSIPLHLADLRGPPALA